MSVVRPEGYFDFFDDFMDDRHLTKPVSPNALRGQMRKFLASSEMKVGDFQRILGVNAGSYNTFLNGKYKDQWNATGNNTYTQAAYFFNREKRLGKKSMANTLKASKPPAAAPKPALPDVSEVELPEDTVYLTPGEVRKELQAVLKTYQCTQAELSIKCGASSGNAMSRFSNAGGDWGGGTQDFYNMAANFLEKLRIKLNKPKSKKRVALEEEAESRPAKKPFLGLNPDARYITLPNNPMCMTKDSLGRNVMTSFY